MVGLSPFSINLETKLYIGIPKLDIGVQAAVKLTDSKFLLSFKANFFGVATNFAVKLGINKKNPAVEVKGKIVAELVFGGFKDYVNEVKAQITKFFDDAKQEYEDSIEELNNLRCQTKIEMGATVIMLDPGSSSTSYYDSRSNTYAPHLNRVVRTEFEDEVIIGPEVVTVDGPTVTGAMKTKGVEVGSGGFFECVGEFIKDPYVETMKLWNKGAVKLLNVSRFF